MYLPNRNLLFIHINKNGGTTVRHHLSNWDNRIISGDYNRIVNGWHYHTPAIQAQKLLTTQEWNTSFKFAFVRNPWDRCVSVFHFRKAQKPGFYKDIDFESWLLSNEEKVCNNLTFGFKSFIDFNFLAPQYYWLLDQNHEMCMDFVGRFEKFEEDFSQICDLFGQKERILHLNKGSHGNYRQYYSVETRKLVEKIAAVDIDFFGYRF